MERPTQEIDPFAYALMEQRNAALTEAAYWRVAASKAQAQLAELQAKLPPEPTKPEKKSAA